MNCFLIKMVFQVTCGNGNHFPQFDEQLRLIFANDAIIAIQKAKLQAMAEIKASDAVKWKLIAVTDVYPFTENLDGAVLFSTITETDWTNASINSIQLKEKNMLAAFNTING